MIFPNKLFTYSESVLSCLPTILEKLSKEPMQVLELYMSVYKKIGCITQFMDALDCLYAMGCVDFDSTEELLTYVERN